MGFEMRKKEKYKSTEKFVIKIREIQEKAKGVLEKAQKEIKRYVDRKRAEVNKYKVEDLVMLSTKDLEYQILKRRTEKLMERFVDFYKINKIILSNAIELKFPSTIRVHLVVNVSRIHRYVEQVERQKKEQLALVIIEGEEE